MNIESELTYLNIDEIIPNRFQPREHFDEEALKELAVSIKEHGIIQPLVVRRLLSGKYEIIAGERRYKASQIAGLKTVPAIITELDDNASAEVALIENIQRKNLSAIEEARSYKRLLDRGYLTQDQLAKRLGISQSQVANKVRLLNLTEEVQDALMDNKISERHARSLLQLTDNTEQVKMLNKIIRDRLTVRETDDEIKRILNGEDIEEIETLQSELEKLETFDFNAPEEKMSDSDLVNLMNTSKKELDNEYETFNIPTAEEPIINVKPHDNKQNYKIISGNIESVLNALKNIETDIKNAGFDIETEDYDFEDLYQIIIKIEK